MLVEAVGFSLLVKQVAAIGKSEAAATGLASSVTRTAFEKVNTTMMAGMDVKGLGQNPDTDFVRMMIPHHQGAIDMVDVLFKAYGAAPTVDRAVASVAPDAASGAAGAPPASRSADMTSCTSSGFLSRWAYWPQP